MVLVGPSLGRRCRWRLEVFVVVVVVVSALKAETELVADSSSWAGFIFLDVIIFWFLKMQVGRQVDSS